MSWNGTGMALVRVAKFFGGYRGGRWDVLGVGDFNVAKLSYMDDI